MTVGRELAAYHVCHMVPNGSGGFTALQKRTQAPTVINKSGTDSSKQSLLCSDVPVQVRYRFHHVLLPYPTPGRRSPPAYARALVVFWMTMRVGQALLDMRNGSKVACMMSWVVIISSGCSLWSMPLRGSHSRRHPQGPTACSTESPLRANSMQQLHLGTGMHCT